MDNFWTPSDEEQLTVVETEIADQETITRFAKLNCCSTLNMYEPQKSKGNVFEWRGRKWISVGGYFKCKGKEYRILPFELNLVREDRARYEQRSFPKMEVKHEA